MMAWQEATIAEVASPERYALATGPFGSAISSKNFVAEGVPVIRGSNLSLDVGVRLNDNGLAFLSEAKANKFQRSVARRGDLVFTCWGTVGQIGMVDKRASYNEYIVSNKQMKLTPDPAKADSTFLYYLLSSQDMVREVTGQAIGAAVPGFNLGQLKDIKVKLPPLGVQKRIADVLDGIDDLIENNRRRAEILEEMARAIYREWFVKFRYPGHDDVPMVDTAMGLIPNGWEMVPASTLLKVNPRIRLDKTIDHPFITMGDLDERGLVCRPSEVRSGGSGSKFERGDTLFARITPCLQNGKTGLVQSLTEGEVGLGSTEFIVLRGQRVGSAFTYCLARDDGFRGHAISSMSGASGRQRVRNECFDSFFVAAPPSWLAESFEATADPLLSHAKVLTDESERLGKLREHLLPKLVTGQIDVSQLDLDELVGARLAEGSEVA